MADKISRDLNKRWEDGTPHHPKSKEMFRRLAELDLECCGDYFRWKSGGDGDNGETLMYQLDVIFEEDDAAAAEEVTNTH